MDFYWYNVNIGIVYIRKIIKFFIVIYEMGFIDFF